MTSTPFAFLSYNHADAELARSVAMFLATEGVSVFFDQWRIDYGESIPRAIEGALSASTHFILLWSRDSSKSGWVQREWEAALTRNLASGSPKLLVLRSDDTEVPAVLGPIKYLEWGGGTECDRANLIESVTGHAATAIYLRAVVKTYWELLTPVLGQGLPAGCPGCGSSRAKRDADWLVDVNPGDHGDAVYDAHEREVLACPECGLRISLDELAPAIRALSVTKTDTPRPPA